MGLDFGLVTLSEYYQKLLAANEVEPIPRKNWQPQQDIEFDEHILLGLPQEFVEDFAKPFTPRPAIIPLKKLDEPPRGHEKPFDRFVGKVFDNVTIHSIEGMSGGPIFGIATASDGKKRYWTVAIQSTWLSKQRITFGCPILVFMGIVDKLIADYAGVENERRT